jgi:hypothetical protein
MWGADLTVTPPPAVDRPVWVDLGVLYRPASDGVRPCPEHQRDRALVLTGREHGLLHRWLRAIDGRWIGLVDFTIHDHSGRTAAWLHKTAVPAEALTKIDLPPRR